MVTMPRSIHGNYVPSVDHDDATSDVDAEEEHGGVRAGFGRGID